jgi:hypothetical protein
MAHATHLQLSVTSQQALESLQNFVCHWLRDLTVGKLSGELAERAKMQEITSTDPWGTCPVKSSFVMSATNACIRLGS